ncbi:unnamed protein product [Dovyalis caffra]|uniref:Uncharacterized protein n=1 Tax=Dovyalis caffra TaxID=77055 RepID=A0AAV1SU16_9ROSI|nr:unnamed protein product [Dovyalis caffra]
MIFPLRVLPEETEIVETPKNGIPCFKVEIGALPMVGQVMSATRGATDAFSGVTRHVNSALWKLGAKNIQAGVGCGVGFGHGFGIGLAVKPGAVQKMQACLLVVLTKMMTKLGLAPNLSIGQGALPMSLQSGMSMANDSSVQNPLGSIAQLATKFPDQTSQGLYGYGNVSSLSSDESSTSKGSLLDNSFGSRTEKVISSFLQNPILKDDGTNINEVMGDAIRPLGVLPENLYADIACWNASLQCFDLCIKAMGETDWQALGHQLEAIEYDSVIKAGRLQSENNILQMVLRHQQIIDELMEENQKLRQILVEDLKVSPNKLQATPLSGVDIAGVEAGDDMDAGAGGEDILPGPAAGGDIPGVGDTGVVVEGGGLIDGLSEGGEDIAGGGDETGGTAGGGVMAGGGVDVVGEGAALVAGGGVMAGGGVDVVGEGAALVAGGGVMAGGGVDVVGGGAALVDGGGAALVAGGAETLVGGIAGRDDVGP